MNFNKKLARKLVSLISSATLTATSLPLMYPADVFAADNSISTPTWGLNSSNPTDSNVHLNWNIDIPTSDIISTVDFEDLKFDFRGDEGIKKGIAERKHGWNYDGNGNLEKDSDRRRTMLVEAGQGVNGSVGLNIHNTYGHGTWYYVAPKVEGVPWEPVDVSKINHSCIALTNPIKYAKGRKIITSFKTKGEGSLVFLSEYEIDGNSYKCGNNITFNENLTAEEFKDRLINRTPIEMNNPEGISFSDSWIISRTSEDMSASYNFAWCAGALYQKDGKWWYKSGTFNKEYTPGLKPGQYSVSRDSAKVDSVKIGDPLCAARYGQGFYFNADNIDTDDWMSISLNADVPTSNMYDYYWLHIKGASHSDLNIDDIQIAYAQKAALYRKDLSTNETKTLISPTDETDNAYTVEYDDTTAIDHASPDAPSFIRANVKDKENEVVEVSWDASADNGTTYEYTLTKVSETNEGGAGGESTPSEPYSVTKTSGILKYELYNNEYTTTPLKTLSADILSTEISIDDLEGLKVVAVDAAGNKSTPTEILPQPAITSATVDVASSDSSDYNVVEINHTDSDGATTYEVQKDYTEIKTVITPESADRYKEVDTEIVRSPETKSLKTNSTPNTSNIIPAHEYALPGKVPSISKVSSDNATGKTSITFLPASDFGDNIDFKVYVSKDANYVTSSKYKTLPVISGVKEYAYVIDEYEDTLPISATNVVPKYTSDTTIEVDNATDASYLHIAAIDNQGNMSATLHAKLNDTTPPTAITNPVCTLSEDGQIASITWDAATDVMSSDLAYKIYYNNTSKIESTTSTKINVSEFNNVSISALDKTGNESEKVTLDPISIQSVENINKTGYKYQYLTVEDLHLPEKVQITTNYGVVLLDANWQGLDSYDYTKSTQVFNANISYNTGFILNPNNLVPKATLTFEDYPSDTLIVANYPSNEEDYTELDTIYLTPVDLSNNSMAKVMVNGIQRDVPINWNRAEVEAINITKLGSNIITGTLATSEGIDVSGITVHMKVNVVPSRPVSVASFPSAMSLTYTGFDDLDLPNKVAVTFNNTQVINIPITWNKSNYFISSLEDQTITGYLKVSDFPLGYTNGSDMDVSIVLKLDKAEVEGILPKIGSEYVEDPIVQTTFNTDEITFQSVLPTDAELVLNSKSNGEKARIRLHDILSIDTTSYNKYQVGLQSLPISLNLDAVPLVNALTNQTLKVKVNPSTIASIQTEDLSLSGILGQPFEDFKELQPNATKVKVLLGNKTVYGDEPNENIYATWQSSDYDMAKATQTLVADLLLPEGISNDLDKQFKANISLKPTSLTRQVIKVEEAEPIKVLRGTPFNELQLNHSVETYLSNGDKVKLEVAQYSAKNYNPQKAGTYTIEGTLLLMDGITNPYNLTYKQKIEVIEPDIKGEGEAIAIKDVESVITIPGKTPKLPDTIRVITKDGKVKEVSVKYDTSKVDYTKPGTYYVDIIFPDDIQPPNGVNPKLEITVIDLFADSAHIIKVLPIPIISIPKGVSLSDNSLCNIVKVQLSDGRQMYVYVALNEEEYNSNNLTPQSITGKFILPTGVTNILNIVPTITVQPIDDTVISSGTFSEKLINLQVKYGTELKDIPLPKSVPITLPEGSVVYVEVSWNTEDYNPFRPNDYKITGTIIGEVYKDITPEMILTVLPNPNDIDGSKTIVDIKKPKSMTIQAGKNLAYDDLPSEIEAILENGTTIKLPVTWDYTSKIIRNNTTIDGELQIPEDLISIISSKVKYNVVATKNSNSSDKPSSSGGSGGAGGGNTPTNSNIEDNTGNEPEVMDSTQKLEDKGKTSENKTDEKQTTKEDKNVTNQPPTEKDTTQSSKTQNTQSNIAKSNEEKTKIILAKMKSMSKEQQKAVDSEVISNLGENIPYTVKSSSSLNWVEVLPNMLYVKVSPNTSINEGIMDVTLKSLFESMTVKTKAVSLQPNSKQYKDVPTNYWACDAIQDFNAKGYASGSSNGKFLPNANVTMADTATFIDRILLNHDRVMLKNVRSYIDTLNLDKTHWAYYSTASILSKLNMSTIESMPNFRKYNTDLTREEVAYLLYDLGSSYLSIPASKQVPVFNDSDKITYIKQITYCTNLGLFRGDAQNNFNPTGKITRAELVTVLTRLDQLLSDNAAQQQ